MTLRARRSSRSQSSALQTGCPALYLLSAALACSAFSVTCRESERVEFAEAKDRLKHSWAADRDDFARVKEQLKKKNAEHHLQNGRLSQALKVIFCCSVCL